MRQRIINGLKASFRGTLLLLIFASALFTGGEQAQSVQAGSTSSCPSGKKCFFVPMVNGVVPAGDLVLNGFEITQAVQDPQNSVPLVEGRTTLLRLFAKVEDSEKPVGNVKVHVSASAASQALMGSPNAFSTTIPLTYDRASLKSTVNIAIPDEWTHGTVDITVRIDPGNEVLEANEANNTFTHRFVFRPVAPLEIKIVPIRYQNPNDNRVYPAPTEDTISDYILRTYPVARVKISFHDPVTFSGNLSSYQGFLDLLQEVSSLKVSENQRDSVVYYGMVPISSDTSTWFMGGIAGIGWVGSRTAVGLDIPGSAPQIAAHEIGHNLGLMHSPCGSVAASSLEKDYPYPDGSIGQYGMSMNRENSTQVLLAPTTKDLMSYCSSRWISDYVYKKLFTAQSQVQTGAAAVQNAENVAQQGLMVRAQISASGAELLPAYILPEPTSAPAAGAYQVEIYGQAGETIAQVPVGAFTADANLAEQSAGINVLVPLPDQPAAGFRLLKDGQVLAEQSLQAGASLAPGAQGGSENQPSLVRYSSDGGETWTTLGVDVSGGELLSRAANPEPGVLYQVIPAGGAQ